MSLWPNKILNLIDGEFSETAGQSYWFEKEAPHSEEKLALVCRSSEKDTQLAIESAKKNWRGWASRSPVQRAEVISEVQTLMERNLDQIAQVVSVETGKSFKDARAETMGAIQLAKYYAGEGQRLYGQTLTSSNPRKQTIAIRQPCGVAGLIISANTPIANFAWKVFPALVCGNSLVLKAAEDTPLSAWYMANLIHQVPSLKGVLNIIHGFGSECGELLAQSKDVNVLSFTGSSPVGQRLGQLAAEHSKKISLELGGKNAMVVCKDAVLDRAVKWALLSSFSNAGQRCASTSRIYVEKEVFSEFKEAFVSACDQLKVGFGDEFDLGPLINKKSLLKVSSAVDTAKREGAKILCGGARCHARGYFYRPTILEGLPTDSQINDLEIFGPVVALYEFSDLEEVIFAVNNSHYGLTSSIHTQDLDRSWTYSLRVQAGLVNINAGTHGSEPHFPFGGLKQSGNGTREPGLQALDVYSNLKVISHHLKDETEVC